MNTYKSYTVEIIIFEKKTTVTTSWEFCAYMY